MSIGNNLLLALTKTRKYHKDRLQLDGERLSCSSHREICRDVAIFLSLICNPLKLTVVEVLTRKDLIELPLI